MQGISLEYIYNLAPRLKPLGSLPKEVSVKYVDVWWTLYSGQQTLYELYGPRSLYGPYLRSSSHLAEALLSEINPVLEGKDIDRDIPPYNLFGVTHAFEKFEVAFLAELHSLTTFLVTRKAPYDILSLLARGEELFSAELPTKVPEAVFDAREAGKSLAFELSTACGFHAMRVVESVLRSYYTSMSGGRPRPKMRNIAVYIQALGRCEDVEEKVLSALRQLNSLHRNPIAHPEAALTLEEATALIGISQSVVASMLVRIPILPLTTSTAVISQATPLTS